MSGSRHIFTMTEEKERIMRGRWRMMVTAAATITLFLGVHASSAQQAPGAKPTVPAAKVEDEVITL